MTANTDAAIAGSKDRRDWLLLGGFSAAAFLLHLAFYKGYGIFRDELYFLACSGHLAWGYVDQPPGVAVAAWASRHIFGDSIFAVRFFPMLFAALDVLLAGLTARVLGGKRYAQALACVCVIAAPIFFVSYLTTDMFVILGWTACAWIAARIFAGESPRLWLVFGLFAGLALEGKHAMLFFGFAFVIALLLSPQRKHFLSPWLWAGGGIAFLLALPNLIWEYTHQWATYELLSNIARSNKNVVLGPVEYLVTNCLFLSPLAFLVALGGLCWLLFTQNGKGFRALGWTWVIAYLLFVALKGKSYYLAPAYPMLFAAGGVSAEEFFGRWRSARIRPRLQATAAVLILAGAAVIWPFAMPMMPVEKFIAYQSALHVQPPKTENEEMGSLPQQYADMFGWQEMAREVARVYETIPIEERAKCAIFGNNYGEAGAIDYFGRQYSLPAAISGHQNYWYWGPRGYSGECLVVIGPLPEAFVGKYSSVVKAGETYQQYAIPYENHRPIWILRGPAYANLQEVWPQLKRWR